MHPYRFLLIIVLLLSACSPRPFAESNKVYKKKAKQFGSDIARVPPSNLSDSLPSLNWTGSVNFNLRKPNYVVIHYTAQKSCDQTLRTFTIDSTQVSAHYVICRDGIVHQMLSDYLRGWHAGLGKWGSNTDINSSSIGIELDNNGKDSFTEAQLEKLRGLLSALKEKYNIPTANFLGHSDIAPGRKIDPGPLFPWKRFSEEGFGLWYPDTTAIVVPQDFSVAIALKIIGYDISKPDAAIHSFRLHFCPLAFSGELSEEEKKILYALMQQAMR